MSERATTSRRQVAVLAPQRSSARWVLAPAAVLAAIAHLPVIPEHLREAPYMGVLFVLLTAACLLLAGAVLLRDAAAVYAAAGFVCGLAVAGYAATRLVAFPQLGDDVGDWLNPLGVLAVLSELTVVAAVAAALTGSLGRVVRPRNGR